MKVIGVKLGMEYLAISGDNDAVAEWVHMVVDLTRNVELATMLFSNIFRGINTVIADVIADAGQEAQMRQRALAAWNSDFTGDDLSPDDLITGP